MNVRLRREAAGAREVSTAEPPFAPAQHASALQEPGPRPRRNRKRRRGRASEAAPAVVAEATAQTPVETEADVEAAAPAVTETPAAEVAPVTGAAPAIEAAAPAIEVVLPAIEAVAPAVLAAPIEVTIEADLPPEIEITVADPSFEAPPAVTVELTPSDGGGAIEVLVAPETPIASSTWALDDDARLIDAMPARAAAAPDPEPGETLGAYLRRFRLARRISLDEVAASTRIPVRSLNLLEADDFGALPAEVFVKGFIRCYTRAVGLDLSVAMGLYEGSRQTAEPAALPPAPRTEEASRPWVSVALVTLIVVILATLTLSILFARPRSSHLERADLMAPPPAAAQVPTDLGSA
jgi:hypothetical protein